MAIIKLFSAETIAKVEAVKVEQKKSPTRTPRANKEPTRRDIVWEREKSMAKLKELEAQDETGWSEYDISMKGKEVNMKLVRNHIQYYSNQLKELRKPFQPMLEEWKEVILNYCKERGKTPLVWFDEDAPADVLISVRFEEHHCWAYCVEFRFEKDKLTMYNSSFDGGTTFLDGHQHKCFLDNKKIIEDLLQRCIDGECENSHLKFYNEDIGKPIEHRKINIDEDGWYYKDE